MAYSIEDKEKLFKTIFDLIESGKSLRFALKEVSLSSSTFFIWIEEDESKSKQYARATELRAENMFEDILSIVDENTNDIITLDDGREIVNNDVIQRARLRMDARKWMLSKLNPKKYGERMQHANDPENPINITLLNIDPLSEDETNNSTS